jgi:hypothetical protein
MVCIHREQQQYEEVGQTCRRCFRTSQGMRMQVPMTVPAPLATPWTCRARTSPGQRPTCWRPATSAGHSTAAEGGIARIAHAAQGVSEPLGCTLDSACMQVHACRCARTTLHSNDLGRKAWCTLPPLKKIPACRVQGHLQLCRATQQPPKARGRCLVRQRPRAMAHKRPCSRGDGRP